MHEDVLFGTIKRIIYHETARGFTVFTLATQKAQTTVTCTCAEPVVGQEVEVHGNWTVHAKFGKQFHATRMNTRLPTSTDGLIAYLSSGIIKGIGASYAEKLVNHFGTDVLTVIDTQPERLAEISGIGPQRIAKIQAAWQEHKDIADVMVALQDAGLSSTYATKIYKVYGREAVAVVRTNPYRLAEEIWGIGFNMADSVARNVGFAHDAKERLRAGILFALFEAMKQGHIYVELEALREKTAALLHLGQDAQQALRHAFHDLYNTAKISLVSHGDTHYIATAQAHTTEKRLAETIAMLQTTQPHKSVALDVVYHALRTQTGDGIHLNEQQQHGIITALSEKVTVITGGPGTGKTTLIKQLLGILEEHNISYKLAAPTGRAAKRITESTGRFAATLHRLLAFDVRSMRFTKNESNAINADVVIVDEASMIDVFLAYALTRAVRRTARLIFIGDADQLPSVGPGNVFRDCIASGHVACVHLTDIFRQAQDSGIVTNAHRVNNGQFFQTSDIPANDFVFLKERDPENITNQIKRAIFGIAKRHALPPQACQILTPMNRGAAGTQKLNAYMQSLLNPESTTRLSYGGTTYRFHDRVMQTRNNYDKEVFNGDIGTVTQVDANAKTVCVCYDNKTVTYEHNELNELVLAYAVSIHKSQGSEYPAVIIPLFTQHFTLLQRNLLYTAITRAQKLCIVIGDPRAIGMAINTRTSIHRTTFLAHLLSTHGAT